MKVSVTEEYLYELFENDDVDGVIKLLEIMGLDGEHTYYYDRATEGFVRYLLSIAIMHASTNHLSNYMLLQLIGRTAACCGIFQLARLIRIAASIKDRNVSEVPEDVKSFLTMGEYSDDDIDKASNRFKGLDEQEIRSLIYYLAQVNGGLSVPLNFNSLILKRVHTYNIVSTEVLLASMMAALYEGAERKNNILQKLTDKMARHIG